jgi:arylsulfatase A-like enzyme
MKPRRSDAPNILLITADQLRWDYVHAYAPESFLKTPALDALAAEGCLCERAYSPNPVCIPARHNLITGLPARYHGFDDNYFGPDSKACPWNLPTFAQILSDCGYATAAIGKMHFQPERRAAGFDLFENCDEVVYDIAEDEYAQFLREQGYPRAGSIHGVRNVLYMQPQQSLLPEELHSSSWVADRSIRYIKSRATRQRPFLLWAGFIHPHPPFDIPEGWAHLYDGRVPPRVFSKTPLSKLAQENRCIADLPDEENINRMRELYACAVSFTDHHVGRILKALDEEGLRENTLVLFVSDHGEMLGDLDTYQKFLPYDASCRIPMLLRWPGHIAPGSRRTDFADLNDILPTLLDAAGTPHPGGLELPGESLLAKAPKKDRSVQYVEHQRDSKRWCCLIGARYKFIHAYGDRDQLFDLREDPEERNDLLWGTPGTEILRIQEELNGRLLEYESRWGLPGCVAEGKFAELPPYEIQNYRECCFPSCMVQEPGAPARTPLAEEILQAIAKEPTVRLEKLHIRELLTSCGEMTDQEVDDLLERARRQGG